MTATISPSAEPASNGRLYRILWRWHFYAGLFCMPFVTLLAITGCIYLFRPQIEAWIDRDLVRLERTGSPRTMDEVVAAARAAIPGSTLAAVVLAEHPDEARRVLVSKGGDRTRVYVHPDTLAILKTVPEQGRFASFVSRLHGELLVGKAGSILVELAASWAIVMILTGLYLWWPRQARGLGGVLYPRIGQGARRFWRDLHAVTGIWISSLALFLLVTGLPWAFVWGESFKHVRQWTHAIDAPQDWSTSSAGEHAEHMHHDASVAETAAADASIDAVVHSAEALHLASPVLLSPPTKASPFWWAKSNAANRPLRADVALSPRSAEPVARKDFADRHVIDRIIGFGIAAHEGQLFGWINQALGVLTASGLVTLCASAFVMWRRRAPSGLLGAPPAASEGRLGLGVGAIILACGVFLPVLGAALITVALIERLVLSHWPAARAWLGIAPTCGTRPTVAH